jgi:hypothetical protein
MILFKTLLDCLIEKDGDFHCQINEVLSSLHGAGFVVGLFLDDGFVVTSQTVNFVEDIVDLVQSVVLFLGRGGVPVIAYLTLIGVCSKKNALVVGLGW